MAEWVIRPYRVEDADAICRIYHYYVTETDISFECEAVNTDEIQRRAAAICGHGVYLVAEGDEGILGYTYAKPWHRLAAYAHTYESTIYLAHDRDGMRTKGLGTALYRALIDELRQHGGVRVLFGVPTLGNQASDRLHEKLDFEKKAVFHDVGFKHGRWLGVTYWAYQFT